LLTTNPQKAYVYGKEVITKTTLYRDKPYEAIIGVIRSHIDVIDIPAEIYRLGVQAYQRLIGQLPYPEISDIYIYYNRMANWYWHAGDISKAIDTQQKAIEALKSKKHFPAREMAALESSLTQYKSHTTGKPRPSSSTVSSTD